MSFAGERGSKGIDFNQIKMGGIGGGQDEAEQQVSPVGLLRQKELLSKAHKAGKLTQGEYRKASRRIKFAADKSGINLKTITMGRKTTNTVPDAITNIAIWESAPEGREGELQTLLLEARRIAELEHLKNRNQITRNEFIQQLESLPTPRINMNAIQIAGSFAQETEPPQTVAEKKNGFFKKGIIFGRKGQSTTVRDVPDPGKEDTKPVRVLTHEEQKIIRQITSPKTALEMARDAAKQSAQVFLSAERAKGTLLPTKAGDEYTKLGAGLIGRDAAYITPQGIGIFSGLGERPPKNSNQSLPVDRLITYDDIAEGKVTMYVASSGRGPGLLRRLVQKVAKVDIGTIVVKDDIIGKEFQLMNVHNPHEVLDGIRSIALQPSAMETITKLAQQYPELLGENPIRREE